MTSDLRKAAEMAAYEVPLHELLEGVPENARLVIDSEDGMSTRFIPVGHLCKRAAGVLRQALSNEFNPDWNQVEALQESLREHMAEIQRLRQAIAQPEQEPVAWIDSIKSGDRVLYDGDAATVFSVLRQRPIAPDYFKLDFDDGSYIDVNDNDLIANGKPVDPVNISQEPVTWAFREHLEALGVDFSKPCAEGNGEQVGPLFTQPADETAKREQEPVAVWELEEDGWNTIADPDWMETLPVGTRLYTAPPSIEAAVIEAAVLAEREACAKVADRYIGADPIAAAIRERGEA